jgi:hypothetical protein
MKLGPIVVKVSHGILVQLIGLACFLFTIYFFVGHDLKLLASIYWDVMVAFNLHDPNV